MGKLYIVGTPIGNMQDITLRAIDTLKNVDVIACEDTRVTRKLLSYHEIRFDKLVAYHDKNERASAQGIIQMIESGKDVAIVSDAGMPVVADPGFEVIRQAIAADVDFEVIPGVSAVTTSIVLSNLDTHFKFLGFLKPKPIQRQNELKALAPGTYIAYLSPHKLESTLEDFDTVFGDSVKIFLGRELTKKFESHYRGTATEVLEQVREKIKGEFTIVFEVKKVKVNKYAKK